MLIDALSQWRKGELESDKTLFKDFVRDYVAHGKDALPRVVVNHRAGKKNPEKLIDCADVLYSGFRCGVLHEAHAKLYCMILGKEEGKIFYIQPTGLTYYRNNGDDCVSVIIDPFELLAEVKQVFNAYVDELSDTFCADNHKLRKNFRKKFRWTFGISVGR